MFGKKKKPKDEDRFAARAVQPMVQPEPALVDILRGRRTEKVKLANDLDCEIAALDSEITWLERNPKAQGVLRELMQKHELSPSRSSG